jgi:DNA-binding transcriptional regulator YhcF (GntR family)
MEFHSDKPIYLQIAEWLCERIASDGLPPGEKMPSVRELAVTLQVNPNTVVRTYDFLQQHRIVINRRGIGFFVEKEADQKIFQLRREDFYQNTLPRLFKTLSLLEIDPEEIVARYRSFRSV